MAYAWEEGRNDCKEIDVIIWLRRRYNFLRSSICTWLFICICGRDAYIVSCFYSHKYCIYGGERSEKTSAFWINWQIFANILLRV